MFGVIKQIQSDIQDIKLKQERIIWIMNEVMKYGKEVKSHNESLVITKQQHRYYESILPVITGRFKRIDKIASSLNVTKKTAITYLKLARKAGHVIETRRIKGQLPSYKLQKGNETND
jgi:hypothetical protein